ncbi:TetR/AcrR family transcriptional regulator [Sporolactobacillus sp. THM7-7]|nr:TetR/AcrR family transcriptional regulator [Sporolactobacillus sp. THM7-7]
MPGSSTDRRTIKTRAAIQSHFLDLLLQKKFNEITVKDIAQAANIGRGTFYLHYEDKYDLLDKVMEDGLSDLIRHFQPRRMMINGQIIPDRVVDLALNMFRHFQEHERFFRAMFFNEGIPAFRSRLQRRLIQKASGEIRKVGPILQETDPMTMAILPVFLSSGMIGLVDWWFQNDRRISKEDMARKIFQVMTKGPLQTLGFKITKGK